MDEREKVCEKQKHLSEGGVRWDAFVMTCEETGFTALQRRRDIFLIFEGMLPRVEFFPLPALTLFARDGAGGYFAHSGAGLESPIYFLSAERECWYLAENFRSFVQMVIFEPHWKAKILGKMADLRESDVECAALGELFGLLPPQASLAAEIRREKRYRIFETEEKAAEWCACEADKEPRKP